MASDNHFEKPAQRKSVLVRNSSYRDNCSAGFTSGDWQAHHIACHHSVNTREIEDEYLEYVENCLWITEWDLNASDNLIGLPVNKQYRSSNGTSPTNYCSHQVDHNTKDGLHCGVHTVAAVEPLEYAESQRREARRNGQTSPRPVAIVHLDI